MRAIDETATMRGSGKTKSLTLRKWLRYSIIMRIRGDRPVAPDFPGGILVISKNIILAGNKYRCLKLSLPLNKAMRWGLERLQSRI